MQYEFFLSRRGGRSALPAVLALASVLALAGCAIPTSRPPGGLIGTPAATASLPADETAQWPLLDGDGAWWRAYRDPQLDVLMAEGLANSPDVASAAARLAKADAITSSAGGAFLPTLDVNSNIEAEKQSTNLGYPPQFKQFLPRGWMGEAQLAGALNYNLDIWGKYRALLAAATSQRAAAAYDVATARATLSASIADAYFTLGGDAARADLTAGVVANRAENLTLVTLRFNQGFGTRADVGDATVLRDNARGELANASAQVLVDRHQLAALLGAGPDRGLSVTPPVLSPTAPQGLPADVTTELIARRPDIAAARARAAAAAAQIRAARADFFPAIRLSALIGWQAVGISQLFDSGSVMGNAGPAISLPIFHAGALRAQYRSTRADAQAAIADYNRAVITAYQQLADAVSRRDAVQRHRTASAAAVAAATDSLAVARARFAHGLAGRIEVLGAGARLATAQDALLVDEAAARRADIVLTHALGGGFAAAATSPASTLRPTQGPTP